MKTCSLCSKPLLAKGLCRAHYARKRRGGNMSAPPVPRYRGQACSVAGCAYSAVSLGMCMPHYNRKTKYPHVPMDAPKWRERKPERYLNGQGYFVVRGPSGERIFEHRAIMEEKIGRPLRPGENVHHRNGHREDNRPENLELWVKRHPPGERAADLVEWAKSILAEYGGLPL